MKAFIKSGKAKLLAIGVLVATLVMSFSPISVSMTPSGGNSLSIGNGQLSLRIGNTASATGSLDYVTDGVNDNVEWAQLFAVLSSHGGGVAYSVSSNYSFGAAVTVPANVIVIGSGTGFTFSRDGINPIFVASSNDTFKDVKTDAGGITLTSDTVLNNVHLGTTYYAYASTGTANFTTINAPTGRTVTRVLAASSATLTEKAQADVVCDGTDDQNEIQTAVNYIASLSPPVGEIQFLGSPFNIGGTVNITAVGDYTFKGSGAVAQTTIVASAGLTTALFNINSAGATITQWRSLSFYNNVNDYPAILNVRSTDIVIDSNIFWYTGIQLHSSGSTFSAINAWITNNWIEKARLYGLIMYGPQNAFISNNYFYDNTGNGIYIDRSGYSTVSRVAISNNFFNYNKGHGIYAERSFNGLSITDNTFMNNGTSANNTYDHIHLKGVQYATIADNKFAAAGTSPITRNSLYVESYNASNVSSSIIFKGNDLLYGGKDSSGTPTSLIPPYGYFSPVSGSVNLTSGNEASLIAVDNLGYVTQNTGTFQINANTWGVSISHGLSTNVSSSVQLTLTSNTTATVYVLGNITTTAFSANLSALQGSTVTGYWRATSGVNN